MVDMPEPKSKSKQEKKSTPKVSARDDVEISKRLAKEDNDFREFKMILDRRLSPNKANLDAADAYASGDFVPYDSRQEAYAPSKANLDKHSQRIGNENAWDVNLAHKGTLADTLLEIARMLGVK